MATELCYLTIGQKELIKKQQKEHQLLIKILLQNWET